MMSPMEIQVAWNAVPSQANQVLQQQASILYRSTQDLSDVKKESNFQSKAVNKVAESTSTLMRFLQKTDQSVHSASNRSREFMEKERKNKQMDIYAPHRYHKSTGVSKSMLGEYFSFTV